MNHKKTVLLIFGGESTEHDVSILSAQNVYSTLDMEKVNPLLCYIDPNGGWWHVSAVEKPTVLDEYVVPLLGTSRVKIGVKSIPIDVIFPVLHGNGGEDGTIQGLAALMHTPIVGCGLDGSLLCIDKTLTKRLLKDAKIPVVPGEVYTADNPPAYVSLVKKLGPVLFIKPARQGSSVGVGKATTEAEYDIAFREAAQYDTVILIEAAIESAREIEIALLGDAQDVRVSIAGEIIPDREFYDYSSKYDAASTSQTMIPANITAELAERIKQTALQAYSTLRCRGLARIDFFVTVDGTFYLNEVNTMPGFTNISMFPKLWEASGISPKMLTTMLIDQAK